MACCLPHQLFLISFLREWPGILKVMQIVGGIYMVYLAYQIYKMGTTEDAPKQVTGFWNGFIMQFVNPTVVATPMTE
ncbi:hypothetical protein J7E78_00630 [Paenibacillus polymyxa]|uniref:hypothetical protein n=1 Tax=Paenibacillus polymyxa TaxID=1406 RepID=UPI001BEB0FD5|nr:hypothetical protein [Paenibacillus polymyxa]MBT2282066.1 hypothetical protein [Paenibacillus polymyxa]